MSTTPLAMFKARVDGMETSVRILAGRVEWRSEGRHGLVEVVPLAAISSVRSSRAGVIRRKVIVAAGDNVTEFSMRKRVAEHTLAVLARALARRTPTRAVL